MFKPFASFRILFVSLLCLVIPFSAHAQRYLGSIEGEVTDTTGAKVPGASVTAEEAGTHFKTSVTTNAAGLYNFAALNPGTYTVTSTATSFQPTSIRGVLLTGGQLQKVDLKLSAGAAETTVDVTGESALLDTGSANIATTLNNQEVTDLPNIGRNPFVLSTLAVGISTGAYVQSKASNFTNPFSGVAVQITAEGNGGHNRLTLDGIPDDPPERFSGNNYTGFVPSPEAVQEVKVQTSIFDAQVGHGNGTVTNTVVRNGTNKYHGSAYYVFQDTYLNANTYEKVPNQNLCFPGTAGCTNTVAPTRRNNDQLSQTGFVLDGPLSIPKIYNAHDKTFFMVAFERYASHVALNYSSRVPTAAEVGGDFSGLCNTFNANGLCTSGIQIYDPQSPVDATGNRTTYFANNLIPANRINKAGAALAGYFPAPNVTGATAQSTLNYISTQTSYPSKYPSFITRIDHKVSDKNTLNAIYFQAGLTQNYPLQGFTKGIGPSGYGYTVYRNTRGGSLDDIHTFNSSTTLDSRFGLVFHPFGLTYPGNQNFDLSSIGISNAGLPYNSFPGVTFNSDSYAGLAAGAGGQISESTTGSLEEILTKTLGRHTVRIGFEGNLLRYNVQNPQSGFGAFNFSRTFTQKNYQTADSASGDPLAALILGDFTSQTYNITPAYALQQIYAAGFIQDDWRVTPKLTLNLGIRYDYESPFTDRQNRQVSNFCMTCVNPIQASVAGLTTNGGLQYVSSSNRYPYPRDLNNLQPRLGAAYQIYPNTVVRAGFGIIYFNTLETPIGTGYSQTTGGSANALANLPINTVDNPFPGGVLLPTGNTLGLSTAVGTNVTFVDPNHVQPKSAQYSASVQQQFLGNLTLSVEYVGTRPTRLEVNHDINVLPQQYYSMGTDPVANAANQTYLNTQVANPLFGKLPSTANSNLRGSTIARNLLLHPFPEFGSVQENYSSIGSAPFNALQVQVSKPMKHHFSLQGSFTWDKLMLHTSFLNNYGIGSKLASFQDPGPTLFGNIFGTVEFPRFAKLPLYERLFVGGWKLNSVARLQNGNLINAPGGVDALGDVSIAPRSYQRYFNTCYQNVSAAGVVTYAMTAQNAAGTYTAVGCDAQSPTSNPAFRQRLSYTVQNNSPYINVRQRIHPLLDASLFKQFAVREGVSFELRGEFFNILNTPNFGGPGTGLGSSTYGSVTSASGILTQANDPRIGQLTIRLNF